MSSKGVALVTGAGQGIGRAISLRLADDGFDVAVNDIQGNDLETLVEEIKLKQRKGSMHVADASIDEQVRTLVAKVVEEHGSLDVMVANAGIALWKPMLQTTEDEWDNLFAVNAKGTFLCYKYAGAQMIAQGRGGRIIGACSLAGKKVHMAAYSATKFAVRAEEFGPHGITVNAYAPGLIETHMRKMMAPGTMDSMVEEFKKQTPVGRTGTTADIASLVSFLVSREAGFITGMSSKGVALVTGAGQGIGRAIALRLADDGFDVAVNDITAAGLETLVEEIKSKQRKSTFHVADVSSDKQVKDLITNVVEHHGGLDVMVANAGIVKWKPLLETTEDDWDKLFAVNAKGTFLCYKYAGAQMVAQGRGGRIIGASSVAGKRGTANTAAYAATKFAIRGLTQSAAIELGPHGITVNAYAPGPIETSMLQYLDGEDAAFFQGKSGDYLEKLSKRSPLGRNGSPADIASLVSYLASKESGFITGQSSTEIDASQDLELEAYTVPMDWEEIEEQEDVDLQD
ncbi:hypothetical protein DXG01_011416 [Tephrocybe rancida]|nr:hypothetical protein DXG01_011416 [Tephrocybe rancida]